MNTVRKLAFGVGALSALSGLASTAHAQSSATASATGSATIIQAITASSTANLGFGTIVKPTTGTSTVTVTAAGSRTVTGGNAVAANGAGVTAASFSIFGEGGQAYSVSIPSSFSMVNGTNTLVVTTSNNQGGPGNLSGALGDAGSGSATFGVGGTFNLDNATVSGAYSGSIVVTAQYN